MNKILYFIDFPLNAGGSNQVIFKQAAIMKKKGYQVKIVLANNEKEHHSLVYDKICQEYGLQSLELYYHISTTMEKIDIITALDEYEILVRIIRAYEPDLIHSSQLNIAVELAARELRIPHLMNIYQTDTDTFNIKWIDVYPQYHCADSKLFSTRWAEGLGIVSKCIRVAYDKKCNREFFTEHENQISIIVIGVVCERKNQLEIIKFVLKCKKNGKKVRLIILGDYTRPYGKRCEEYVEKNDLQEEVTFTGFVMDIESYLEMADLAIIASTVESYPGVIVECMANRVPVMSTATGGVTELLKDEENGFLIKGNNADDIYFAFLNYLKYKNKGKIVHIVENAYATYINQHTYEVVGKQLEMYYEWIIIDYSNRKDVRLSEMEVRECFEKFIFQNNLDRNDLVLMKCLWFLYHLSLIYEKSDNRKTIIWGAGHWGKITLEWLKCLGMYVEFVGFIDSVKKGRYQGELILDEKEKEICECGIILVAVADLQEQIKIMCYLEKCGKIRNRDYFTICSPPERI